MALGEMANRMKKVLSKKTAYLVCVFLLNLIEFLRATQSGIVWEPAVNCTGFAMALILFSVCPLKRFLNLPNYIYTVICAIGMIAVRFHWSHHVGEYSLGQIETAVINAWWLGLMLHYLFQQVIIEQRVKLNIRPVGWLWIAMTIWTVIGSSGNWWPIWFLLMFGCFYVTPFAKAELQKLWDAVINGTIASFFVIQSYAYLFRPYDEVRYKGAFSNCNAMALYYAIVYVMVLVKLHDLHQRNAKIGWKVFYFIGAGGLLSFQFMTLCRTAWLASIMVTLCYGVSVIHAKWQEAWGRVLIRGIALALCAVLTFPAVYLSIRYLPTIHPHPVWFGNEYNEERVHSWDPADSEKYVSLDEFLEAAFGRFYTVLQFIESKNPLVMRAWAEGLEATQKDFYVEEADISWLDESMRKRVTIFQTYLKHASWTGHSDLDNNFYWEDTENRIWHAQNLWIQMTYTYGYPVGVLSVLLTVLVLVSTYRTMKRGNDAHALLPFFISVLFFLFGVTEIVWNPGQLVLTLVFLVQRPQPKGE